jgi:hypothetical protein
MSTYLILRTARILLWGAFLLCLGLATTFKANSVVADDSAVADVIRYAPPAMLLLALLVGLAERIVRKQNGLAAKRFGRT